MNDKIINYFMWLMMLGMFSYFLFSKGWIFNDFENISTDEAKYLIENDRNLTLLDVRSVFEYQRDYIGNAINIPFIQLKQSLEELNSIKSTKILVYSERAKRSVKASRLLSKYGFTVINLNGGMVFWIRKGYVVTRH